MTKRPAKPANMPWLSPYLSVKDPERSIRFYTEAFGFEPKDDPMRGPDGRIMHVEMKYQDTVIMFGPEDMPGNDVKSPKTGNFKSPLCLCLYCDDVDSQFEKAKKAGAKVVTEPVEMFWGDRFCKLEDPDGHLWSLSTNVADFDPKKAPAGCCS